MAFGGILRGDGCALLSQTFPPKAKFSVDQIPDQTGKVFIVTGGNKGVGYHTVKALLQHNGKVYIASRSKARVDAAIESLKKETENEALFLELDLSSLASVRKAAREFLSKEKELHVLFNNGGVVDLPMDQLSAEGYDYTLAANTIGHFYFTELLMPALFAGQASSPDGYARVITTSSILSFYETLHYDWFRDSPARRKKNTMDMYHQSKFGNVVVARRVAQRYGDKGILSMPVHPGILMTGMNTRDMPIGQKAFLAVTAYPPVFGALTQLWGGLMPEPTKHNGEFLIPWGRVGRTRKEAYDPEVGEKFWNWLQEEVKNFEQANPLP
ncbi:hypothetical protein EIP91_002132 [Steccherinum ochraceum]|uniref:NAD(P)-binding protein n=1 Tax=Steccherinum ochraceum TaxID=92696 RepID=A0A4R0RCR1_9APHY|nr:hypothetical protein EIP91_002132 [Steccherinum ochraceum]